LGVPLENYNFLEHGYAVTTHKAQGITVERAHVLLGGTMQNRESSYVQLSRAKESTQIYIEAAEIDRLAAAVDGPPTDRMLAYAHDLEECESKPVPTLCSK